MRLIENRETSVKRKEHEETQWNLKFLIFFDKMEMLKANNHSEIIRNMINHVKSDCSQNTIKTPYILNFLISTL